MYLRFKDNIWAEDLTEIGSLPCKHRNVKHFLYVIGVFTKYAWVKPLKDNDFIEIVDESNRKANKIMG